GRIKLKRDLYHPGAILNSALVAIQSIIEDRKQVLVLKVSMDLPEFWVDKDRLTQVTTNLLANASKYTPPGGTITLEARVIARRSDCPAGTPPEVKLPAVMTGIHDTGMGIAEADQPKIFSQFYRTDEVIKQQISGSGLGLTIVKSFVELHGG